MTALRIALLTYSTRPRGGVVHTLALAEALARAGHDVTVGSLARGGDTSFFRPVDPRVRTSLVPFVDLPDEGVGSRIVRSIAVLRAAFDAGEFDIVHAQDCISANAVDHCIRTIHHLDTFTTPELAACHERAIVTPYAHVCVSASVASEVEAGWGLTPEVIPNGVESERFALAALRGDRDRWVARFGRYVVAVGGIEPRKGTLELVEAMALLQQRLPGVRLVMAGGETLFDYRDYRATVLARAAELGVEPVLLGPVEHDVLPGLVAAASAFAFPSTKEGFGLAPMEALAARVPVVARGLPVLREVLGDAVLFADDAPGFAAALESAITSPNPGRTAAGAALAARHTWDDAAAAHLAFYAAHPIASST